MLAAQVQVGAGVKRGARLCCFNDQEFNFVFYCFYIERVAGGWGGQNMSREGHVEAESRRVSEITRAR